MERDKNTVIRSYPKKSTTRPTDFYKDFGLCGTTRSYLSPSNLYCNRRRFLQIILLCPSYPVPFPPLFHLLLLLFLFFLFVNVICMTLHVVFSFRNRNESKRRNFIRGPEDTHFQTTLETTFHDCLQFKESNPPLSVEQV